MIYDSNRDRARLNSFRQREAQEGELDASERPDFDQIEEDFQDTCWVGEHREDIAQDDFRRLTRSPVPTHVVGSAEGTVLFPGFGGDTGGDLCLRAVARAALTGRNLAVASLRPRKFLDKLERDDE